MSEELKDVVTESPDPLDDMSAFDDMELGSINPDDYQPSEDDGCEGGACKI